MRKKTMKYSDFNKKNNLIELLLKNISVFETKSSYKKIDFFPDFDISEYNREIDSDYYFSNSLKFPSEFKNIIKVSFDNNIIFHFDNFKDAEEEFGITFLDINDFEKSINEISEIDKNYISENGFDTDFEEFKLKTLRLKKIDNNKKKIIFEGNIFASSYMLDQIDWNLFSFVEITGIKSSISEFYKELISESYILKIEHNYKISFFIMFSALESYVNYTLKNDNSKKEFSEKITDLFNSKFNDILKHQIYSSIIDKLDSLTKLRNSIAHGKSSKTINIDELESLFIFVLTIITTVENNNITFKELYENLEKSSCEGLLQWIWVFDLMER
jgi:hypothetical protein